MLRNKKHIWFTLAMLIFALRLSAVPAKPTAIVCEQPDGTAISVMLHGDERGHIMTTIDGYPLLRADDGAIEYATIDDHNELVGTGVLAADPKRRSVDMITALERVDVSRLDNVMSIRRSGSRRVAPESQFVTFPVVGSPRCLVILVEFSDKFFTIANPKATFEAMINSRGYRVGGATGSIADYYADCSGGLFAPQFDVYGPVRVSRTMAYYGANLSNGDDKAPEEVVIEACKAIDSDVDFSVYDNDGDGKVDNVYVYYAGYGEADSAIRNTIWPHSWDIIDGTSKEVYLDGVLIDHYAMSNELAYSSQTELAGIGTFVHEFGHVMGLPDVYATSYTGSFTPGEYSVMDHGSYNNNSRTPPLLSGYERYCLGWVEPKPLDDMEFVSLKPTSAADGLDDVRIINTPSDNEYFILENRQNDGWDAYIPGHGMIVWHIDFDPDVWLENTCNNVRDHLRIDLVEADNMRTSLTRDGDPFPGVYGITSFTDNTTPSLRSWDGTALNSPITDIEETPEGNIRFSFRGGKESSVELTFTDGIDAQAIYYNLQGQRIVSPTPGQPAIKVTGATATKLLVR